jgi:hypothetical protein
MPDFHLKKTVRVQGKDITVPITYEREGAYYVYAAPLYRVEVKHLSQAEAYRRFEAKLIVAVEAFVKSRK